MSSDSSSYLLAPHFGPMPRDGKIQLGNIFEHPLKVYDFPISRSHEPVASTRSAPSDIAQLVVNKSGIWGAELWARFLTTFRYDVDTSSSQTFSLHYRDIRTVYTEEFDPRQETIQEYINRRIRNESELGQRLDQTSIFSRPVYTVIGIQYAMSMTYELTRHSSGQGRLGAEGPIASEIDAKATAGQAKVDQFGLKTTVSGEFIFAYQMLEIRPRGLRWVRPPAAVWGGDGAMDDPQVGDDYCQDGYSYGVAGTKQENEDAAGEGSARVTEPDTVIFREKDIISMR